MINAIPEAAQIRNELSEFLRTSILAKGLSFDEHTSLQTLGVDSLALVEMLLFIERRFSVFLPDSHVTQDNLRSIDSLANCVHELLSTDKRN